MYQTVGVLSSSVTLSNAVVCGLFIVALVYLLLQARFERHYLRRIEAWESSQRDKVKQEAERDARKEFQAELGHAREAMNTEFREWKSMYGASIRQDAIARSRAVIAGKVAENIAPFIPIFPYNPKDARFLGSPIDFIVFDGLDEGALREVVLVEMKTEASRITARQKQIADAVTQGRVSWQTVRWSFGMPDELEHQSPES